MSEYRGRAGLEARFWAKVEKTDGCWNWTASRSGPMRYGRMVVDGHTEAAHRIAWTLANGPIPDGLRVLHECDNPACVRVEHLRLGTQSQNMRGAVQRQRLAQSKLTDELVLEMRRRHAAGEVSIHQLAREHGMSWKTISEAIRGISWKHVPLAAPEEQSLDHPSFDELGRVMALTSVSRSIGLAESLEFPGGVELPPGARAVASEIVMQLKAVRDFLLGGGETETPAEGQP